ncbi:hypothetical protein D9M68_450280 [compost metagenome]
MDLAVAQPRGHDSGRQQQGQTEADGGEARSRDARIGVTSHVHQLAVFGGQQGVGQPAFAQPLAESIRRARGGREPALPVLRRQRRRGAAHLARRQGLIHDPEASALSSQAPQDADAQRQHSRGDEQQRHRQHGRNVPGSQDLDHAPPLQMDLAMRYSQ